MALTELWGIKPTDRGHGDDGVAPLLPLRTPLVGTNGGPDALGYADVDRNGQVWNRHKLDHQKRLSSAVPRQDDKHVLECCEEGKEQEVFR